MNRAFSAGAVARIDSWGAAPSGDERCAFGAKTQTIAVATDLQGLIKVEANLLESLPAPKPSDR